MKYRSSRGFSVTEVLWVVGIVAIVLSMAVPQLRQSMGSYRLSGSAERLAAELNLARMLAVSRNAIYRIDFNAQNGSFQIIDPADEDTPPRVSKTLEAGVSFGSLPANPIVFYPRGHAQGGAIEIQDGSGYSIDVSVNASGLVQVGDMAYE